MTSTIAFSMGQPIPARFSADQQAVEAFIRAAFRGVTRTGGISWTESAIIDGDGSGWIQKQARAQDTETCWEDLVDDPTWFHEPAFGGFCFLDPVGFRYYLAPALIRCTREGGGEWTSYVLAMDGELTCGLASLLNPRQNHAVARYVRLMIAIDRALGRDIEPWVQGYRLHWRQFDRGDLNA